MPPRTPSAQGVAPSPSPLPSQRFGPPALLPPSLPGPGQLLSQQAHRLLEEARQENRMLEEAVTTLKEQVNIYEQEVDQVNHTIHLLWTIRV